MLITQATRYTGRHFVQWHRILHIQGISSSSSFAQNDEYPRIPARSKYDAESCELRRKWVEEFSNTKLDKIKGRWNSGDGNPEAYRGNIEMPIGIAQIPLAVAGPLLFNGKHAQGPQIIPLATAEGALVASVSRGAAAITRSGGVETYAGVQQSIRAPVFTLRNPQEAHIFSDWLEEQLPRLQALTPNFSKFVKLKKLRPIFHHESVHMQFVYETGDAAGQNGGTVVAAGLIEHIKEWVKEELQEIHIKHTLVDAHASGDKHPNTLTSLLGRGVTVSARAIITEEILNSYLNIDSRTVLRGHRIQRDMNCRLNTDHNINQCNVIAAVFAATGQDLATVGECSTGHYSLEPNTRDARGGVEIRTHIPNMAVGTVGGGTQLPTQKECLQIMGCDGTGKVRKLAEIIAGFCLALDLSTYSAIITGEFAKAHNDLGRNRPDQ